MFATGQDLARSGTARSRYFRSISRSPLMGSGTPRPYRSMDRRATLCGRSHRRVRWRPCGTGGRGAWPECSAADKRPQRADDEPALCLPRIQAPMPTQVLNQYSAPQSEALDALHPRLEALAQSSGARALAVAVYDLETRATFQHHADRWFHAASTIKVAILLGVYASIHHGWLLPHSRLHVRNRFFSAVDGSLFRVLSDRDANAEVHAAIGKMLRISELALHMIATSSNLATNLLLDLVGLDTVQRSLDELGIDGIDIRRGVEDERAFEHGISNRV